MPTVTKQNHGGLRALIDSFLKHKGALEALGEPVGEWDTLLIRMIVVKLDNNTRNGWEEAQNNNANPTIKELMTYLNDKCRIMETLNGEKGIAGSKSIAHSAVQGKPCIICNTEGHSIYKCQAFLELSISQRIQRVKELALCLNCLKGGHFAHKCNDHRCFICKKSHNKLLHLTKRNSNETKEIVAAHSLTEA